MWRDVWGYDECPRISIGYLQGEAWSSREISSWTMRLGFQMSGWRVNSRTNVDFRNISCLVTYRDSSNKQRVASRKARAGDGKPPSKKMRGKSEEELEASDPLTILVGVARFFFCQISKDTDPPSRVQGVQPCTRDRQNVTLGLLIPVTKTCRPKDCARARARALTKVNKTRLLIAIAAPQ